MDFSGVIGTAAAWIPALLIMMSGIFLGFLLASCYFAGPIATELSHDALTASPFIPLVLLWIGAFVRDSSIFF